MQVMTLADHVSSFGMTSGTVAFLLMQILSLGMFWIVSHQYMEVVRKHRALVADLKHDVSYVHDRHVGLTFWWYVFFTLAVTIVTTGLFLWQPHFL